MKINNDSVRSVGRAIGAACLLSLVTGCGPAGREIWKDILGGHAGSGGQGGGGNQPPEGCEPIDFDELFELINDDLSGEDADDKLHYRYLSLANRHDSGRCESASLDVDRQALNKAVNMLSIAATIETPLAVDDALLLYRVDLRDYEWDRAIDVGGQSFSDAWEAVAASNVYAVPFVGEDADDAAADTGTTIPVMFADSFLSAAFTGELYYALIGVPEDVDAFISNELQIDIEQNFEDRNVVRAGFSGASIGLPDNSFLAERHDIQSRSGVLWQISDFGGGPDGLFDDPLGQPQGEREIVFTLPNGMLGFALADAGGQRLEDSDLLLDTTQSNFAYRVASSPISRYALGFDVTDEVRQAALSNPDLSQQEKALVRALYPNAGRLASLLDEDRERFYANALVRAGLSIDLPEPIGPVLASFDADVDLATAAGDVLQSPAAFENNIRELPEAVQVLDGGGRLDRDDWTSQYVLSLCILSVVLENAPEAAVCDDAFSNIP